MINTAAPVYSSYQIHFVISGAARAALSLNHNWNIKVKKNNNKKIFLSIISTYRICLKHLFSILFHFVL